MLAHAWEQEQEERAWEQYLTLYPLMVAPSPHTKQNKPLVPFKPFSEFLRKSTNKLSVRPTEEILEEARQIQERVKGR